MSEHARKLTRAVRAIEAVLSDLGGRTCEDALDRITSAARAGVTVVADVRDELESEDVIGREDEYGFDGQRHGW